MLRLETAPRVLAFIGLVVLLGLSALAQNDEIKNEEKKAFFPKQKAPAFEEKKEARKTEVPEIEVPRDRAIQADRLRQQIDILNQEIQGDREIIRLLQERTREKQAQIQQKAEALRRLLDTVRGGTGLPLGPADLEQRLRNQDAKLDAILRRVEDLHRELRQAGPGAPRAVPFPPPAPKALFK